MQLSHAIVYIFLNVLSTVYGNELDDDGWLHLRLWHALNDDPVPNFIERGNVSMSSLRRGASTIGQAGLQQAHIDELKNLAKNDGKYRLQAIARTSSGNQVTLLASIPACQLLGSDLEDTLTIWLDSAAEPIALTMTSSGPCSLDSPFTKMWTTNVVVKFPDGGPVPDTATYIHKLEREREARERGETKDNRSFLAKYWMYIVPALILVVLTSATNPEAAAGGGGSAQRQ